MPIFTYSEKHWILSTKKKPSNGQGTVTFYYYFLNLLDYQQIWIYLHILLFVFTIHISPTLKATFTVIFHSTCKGYFTADILRWCIAKCIFSLCLRSHYWKPLHVLSHGHWVWVVLLFQLLPWNLPWHLSEHRVKGWSDWFSPKWLSGFIKASLGVCTYSIAPEIPPLSGGKCLVPRYIWCVFLGSLAGGGTCSSWASVRESELDGRKVLGAWQASSHPTLRDTLTDTSRQGGHGRHEHDCLRLLRCAQPGEHFQELKTQSL